MGLTNKQVRMLNEFVKKHNDKLDLAFFIQYDCTEDMMKDIDSIINVHWTETITRDIERYVADKITDREYAKR